METLYDLITAAEIIRTGAAIIAGTFAAAILGGIVVAWLSGWEI